MQKKHLLLILLMALFAPLAMNGQNTITLNGNLTQTIAPNTSYTFYDSGGPSGAYSTSETYTATFNSTGNITINFSQFVTESSSNCYNWDYMLIYDGSASTGNLICRGQTGCSSATLTTNTDYTATSGVMTVEWHSDGSTTAAGWTATITGPTTDPAINLSPSSAIIITGSTQTLTATTFNVTNPTITYRSSNTSIATVSGSGTTATVTAVAPGTATITATMNGSYTATCAITVADLSSCEGFETDLGLWTVTAENSNYSWARKAGTGGGSYSSAGSGSYNVGAYYSGRPNSYTYLTLNADLSSFTDKTISFMYINPAWGSDIDYIYLQYSTDGTTYTDLASYTSGVSSWTQITALAIPNEAKYIRFAAYGNYGYGTGLDEICLDYTSGSLHVTVWTETDQHEAWGTVQIGNDTAGTDVDTYVNEGDEITVTATPDECHNFAYWIKNGSGNNITQNPATITVDADLDLQAVFTAITYNVTATPNNASYGSVSGGGNNLECGSTCTLTATANTGYAFMGWQQNGSTVSTDNPYIFTANADATYTALFEEVSQHTITVTQATGGTITANPTTAYMNDVITLSATPETGYFFVEWIVEDASHNPITVNNNQFTMPNSDVTVTASFTQGFNVTLVQTEHGTISASQTSGLQPGDQVTLTATPDNDCVFLAWYAYTTGNPRDVIAVISNTTILMPSSDVTVQAIFVTEEEQEQTVGGGSNTGNYLPTNAYYNYSLTQQIYTATEIAYNGRITAIAFKALADISSSRSLDIYMSHTDLSTFSSNTSWEVMGSVALVYSGSVSFANNDWTTITLDTPFEYDGTSNLIICVIDKTGDDESGTRAFSTYGTSANRALYIYSDDTNYSGSIGYSNQLSSLSGTLLQSNNQIVFTIKVPGSAASLTVSPDAINDFSYVEGQGPSGTHKLDVVGVDLENDITITAPTNFEISLTEDGTYSNSVTIELETGSKGNRTITSWDFEDGLQGWTVVDADGDGYNWVHNTSFGGHNGSTGIVYSQSYDNSAGTLDPDNWLISPQVELGGSFSMWAHPQQAAYPAEHFGIYVSTTNTDISSFTLLDEWTLNSGDWKQFSVDLRLYTGQTGYIAVRHFNGMDQFYINVDDFMLDTDAAISIEMPVTITPATVYVRMKDNLNAGTYSGTLTASAGSGDNLNGSVSLSGEVIAAYNITLTANPTEGGAVEGAGSYATGTKVTVSARANAPYSFINWTENGTEVSTDAEYTFTVDADRNLVANFGFTKHIEAYTSNDNGWYLIASPVAEAVTPTEANGFLTNNYDLYYFNQNGDTEGKEWINIKQGSEGTIDDNFKLVNGKGYLYANSQDVDLVFTGTANTTNDYVTLTVGNNPDQNMHGWNLVGNPFAVDAYISVPFYTLEDVEEVSVYIGHEANDHHAIAPMEGILVYTNTDNNKLNFSTDPGSKGSSLNLNLTQGRGGLIDRAIVCFNDSQALPKMQFRDNSSAICIPVDGKDYAVVSAQNQGEMPVSFKAEENGTYTLSFNSEDVTFGYLHLVDNMTGADIDLLANPSYTFEAKKTDYRSRFKLVFATGNADDDFAFCSNGNWVINNDGNATLQVIDVNGRIIRSESINGCANVNLNVANGVYMIRLINGSNVKTQKVVVR